MRFTLNVLLSFISCATAIIVHCRGICKEEGPCGYQGYFEERCGEAALPFGRIINPIIGGRVRVCEVVHCFEFEVKRCKIARKKECPQNTKEVSAIEKPNWEGRNCVIDGCDAIWQAPYKLTVTGNCPKYSKELYQSAESMARSTS